MNIRSTTPVLKKFATTSTLVAAAVLMTFSTSMTVYADQFDDKIKSIQSQINTYQAEASKLNQQATTLQAAISALQTQQATLQSLIDLSQVKYDQLVGQIEATELKIDKNERVLSQTIADLYVNGAVSPVEMLASSHNIGDYLDQQEFRSSIRDQIEGAIKDIKNLKKKLETQRDQAKTILDEQSAQKAELIKKQQEQATLLAQTQGNEANYRNLIGTSGNEINSLKAQQAAQAAANNARASRYGVVPAANSGADSYPRAWANAAQDAFGDTWGMYNRECVSYAAWKVHEKYGNMPAWGKSYLANANQWPGLASMDGIPTGSTPKVGSVAMYYDGEAGHVAWVEGVNGDSVTVSQYNYFGRSLGNGRFSQMTVSRNFFDVYIYFGER